MIHKSKKQHVKRNVTVLIALAAGFVANAQPFWTADENKYQSSMTITAQLHTESGLSVNKDDVIGVFFGEECRGVAHNNYEYNGQVYSLITVYGDKDDETLTVKVYSAASGETYNLKQYLTFRKDSIMGDLDNPFVFYTNLNEKKLLASNFITPNDDGKNDFFVVEDLVAVRDLTLKVFTYRGEEVFMQKDYDNSWSGKTKNGNALPQGTYYYLFVNDKGETVYQGSITLVLK